MKYFDLDLRVAIALAKREFVKYWRSKSRVITSLCQSLMFLFIFGVTLGNAALVSAGIIPQAVLFAGIFSGVSIVQDRMFGFLKEIMVAPISRTTISFGKAVGGTLIASIQGIIILLLTSAFGFFGYNPFIFLKILAAVPIIFLIALLTTGLGNLISTRLKDFSQMQYMMTFLVFPMFFTSGALINFVGTPFYPYTLINPMTYAVDAMRQVLLFGTPELSYGLPIYLDLVVVFGFAMAFILLAALIFRKSESV